MKKQIFITLFFICAQQIQAMNNDITSALLATISLRMSFEQKNIIYKNKKQILFTGKKNLYEAVCGATNEIVILDNHLKNINKKNITIDTIGNTNICNFDIKHLKNNLENIQKEWPLIIKCLEDHYKENKECITKIKITDFVFKNMITRKIKKFFKQKKDDDCCIL
ncbi:hypothetical protein KAH94_00345 [bacterium]|nr:hypothetical protein [bacterium]